MTDSPNLLASDGDPFILEDDRTVCDNLDTDFFFFVFLEIPDLISHPDSLTLRLYFFNPKHLTCTIQPHAIQEFQLKDDPQPNRKLFRVQTKQADMVYLVPIVEFVDGIITKCSITTAMLPKTKENFGDLETINTQEIEFTHKGILCPKIYYQITPNSLHIIKTFGLIHELGNSPKCIRDVMSTVLHSNTYCHTEIEKHHVIEHTTLIETLSAFASLDPAKTIAVSCPQTCSFAFYWFDSFGKLIATYTNDGTSRTPKGFARNDIFFDNLDYLPVMVMNLNEISTARYFIIGVLPKVQNPMYIELFDVNLNSVFDTTPLNETSAHELGVVPFTPDDDSVNQDLFDPTSTKPKTIYVPMIMYITPKTATDTENGGNIPDGKSVEIFLMNKSFTQFQNPNPDTKQLAEKLQGLHIPFEDPSQSPTCQVQ